MGGCATKPKVLKDAAAGAPMPEPQTEEGAEDLAAVKEGVGADDEAKKRHSLSNLFKESEDKSIEDGKDETYETKEETELSASNPKETEKPKCAEEQTPAPVDDAPAKTEAQKAQEVASTVEVPKLEKSCEEKIEDIETTTEGKKDEMPEVRTEEKPTEDSQKPETPVEKKTEDTQHPEKKTEEAAPATPQIEDKKPPSTLEKTMEN